MRLARLIEALDPLRIEGPLDADVSAVTRDSREVTAVSVFVAVRGARVDGHDLVGGLDAACIVVERWPDTALEVPVVQVADTRRALARLAAALNGLPSHQLAVVGVTGTNGKTTTTALLDGALRHLGRQVGRIGTTGSHLGEATVSTGFTTPEAPALQSLLAQMVQAGTEVVVMEVSSIGLAQARMDATQLHTAVFTNLTRDHLDFHGTLERYARAKARLFDGSLLREPGGWPRAILCSDDPAWQRMAPPADHWTYGTEPDADLYLSRLALDGSGSSGHLRTPVGEGLVSTVLPGRFNLLNAVAAVGVLLTLDVPLPAALQAVAAAPGPRGRLERVTSARPAPTVLVDYAHTPDALESVLEALRPVCSGRLWLVFGCGGDRDLGKRPQMGRAAAEGADEVVLTSDNPRGEDPQSIVDQVLSGMDASPAHVLLDRREAIRWAIGRAGRDDVVLIAGKGHETTQEIGGQRLPFDDVDEARAALGEGSWS